MKKINIYLLTIILIIGSIVTPSLIGMARAASLNGDKGWNATDIRDNSYGNIKISKGNETYHAYCYSPFISGPANYPGKTSYERFGYYEGMNNLSSARGDKETIERVAAVLVAGYPNDQAKLSGLAKQSMIQAESQLHQNCWSTVNDFMSNATQVALWASESAPVASTEKTKHLGIAGLRPIDVIKSMSPYAEIFNTPYTQALYQYGVNHPIDVQTAEANDMKIVNSKGQTIDKDHPLVVENGKSDNFKITDYNGVINLSNLQGVTVCESKTGQSVTQLEEGIQYYIKGNRDKEVTINGSYTALGKSYFWEPDVEPYPQHQNLVYLDIANKATTLPVIFKTSTPWTPLVPAQHKVVISKQDVSGKEIAGAKLELTQNGEKVDSWTSEAGKSHNFSAEADKEYVLTETTAPKGYVKAESITFKVDTKGNVQVKEGNQWVDAKDNKVVMLDRETTPWTPLVPAQHKVVISKQDVSGKEIAGAKLKVTLGGKEVDSWTSEESHSHDFSAEVDKEYVLTETMAPKGYKIAENITFKVDSKGNVQVKQDGKWIDAKDNKVVMKDKKVKEDNGGPEQDNNQGGKGNHNNVNNSSHYTSMDQTKYNIMKHLPQTGAQWGQFLSVIGLILVLIALCLYFIIRRKHNNN